MGKFVTGGGFSRPTLRELKARLESGFRNVFGSNFDINQDSPNGYLIAMLSRVLGDIYEMGQEIYDAHTPEGAEGVSLDDILALSSMKRLGASATQGRAMVFTDKSGSVTIPAESSASSTNGYSFKLDNSVVFGSIVDEVRISINESSAAVGTSYTFSIGSESYTIVHKAGVEMLYALKMAIDNKGTYTTYWTSSTMNVLSIRSDSVSFGYTLPSIASVTERGLYGNFTCTESGSVGVQSGQLSVVDSSVYGWSGVWNYEPLYTGREFEDDADARVRLFRESSVDRATGTDKSIASHLVNDVVGVTAAIVRSNRSMVTDENGIPPKAFHAVVTGGRDEDIAKCIYDNMCSGIEPFGTTYVRHVDENGDVQMIGFSRPQPVYLWIKVEGSIYDEEAYPKDGDNAVRDAIVEWASSEYTLNKDIIPERILSAVYKVSGIGRATIRVAVKMDSTSMPSDSDYTLGIVGVGVQNYAVVDKSRISVSVQ